MKGQKEFKIKPNILYFIFLPALYLFYTFSLLFNFHPVFQQPAVLILVPIWSSALLLSSRAKIGSYHISRPVKEKILFFSIFMTFVITYFTIFSINVPIIIAQTPCTPSWSCTSWQPVGFTDTCTESISQTRSCTDTNNCGTGSGKPAETATLTRDTDGTSCTTYGGTGTCQNGGCSAVQACSLSDADRQGYYETCKDSTGTYKDYCSGQTKQYYICESNRCALKSSGTCSSGQTCVVQSNGQPQCQSSCSYALTTTPKGETQTSGSYTWTIKATDSSSGAGCPNSIEYKVVSSTSGSCSSTGVPSNIVVNKGGTATTTISATATAGQTCSVTIDIKGPDGKSVDPATYTVGSADTTLPSVGQISPDKVEANKDVTFSAQVSDNIGVASCNLFVSGVDQGAMSLSSPCTSCTATKVYKFPQTGTYRVLAQCKDAAGNTRTGEFVNVQVVSTSGFCSFGFRPDITSAYYNGFVCDEYELVWPKSDGGMCVVGYNPKSGTPSGGTECKGVTYPNVPNDQGVQTSGKFVAYGKLTKCPTISDSSFDGKICVVKKDCYGTCCLPLCWGGKCGCYSENREGKWSQSTQDCLKCNGPVATHRYASTGGVDVTCDSSSQGSAITDRCESGCDSGVPAALDDSYSLDSKFNFARVSYDAQTLDCPNSNTLKVRQGDSFTVSYQIKGVDNIDTSQTEWEYVWVYRDTGTGKETKLCSEKDVSACKWSSTFSNSIASPTSSGTYTYDVVVHAQKQNPESLHVTDCSIIPTTISGYPDDKKTCKIETVECTNNNHCAGKLVGGLQTTCDLREDSLFRYQCRAPLECLTSSQCGEGFCCKAEIGTTSGNCEPTKTVVNPYICK